MRPLFLVVGSADEYAARWGNVSLGIAKRALWPSDLQGWAGDDVPFVVVLSWPEKDRSEWEQAVKLFERVQGRGSVRYPEET